MKVMKRIIVFSAHPDDDAIGMGGTIAKFSIGGWEVVGVVFTSGEEGYPSPEMKDRIVEIRKEEIEKADRLLGIRRIFLGLHDMDIRDEKEIFHTIIRIIRKESPSLLFTHYKDDLHRDHRVVSSLVEEAWWQSGSAVSSSLGKPHKAKALYFYETMELIRPSLINDISDTFETKMKAVSFFSTQKNALGKISQWVEGLAKIRGYQAGCEYGEAFLESKFIPGKNF
jgi:LmbE family N-acetylglucosaminyl deacetylase